MNWWLRAPTSGDSNVKPATSFKDTPSLCDNCNSDLVVAHKVNGKPHPCQETRHPEGQRPLLVQARDEGCNLFSLPNPWEAQLTQKQGMEPKQVARSPVRSRRRRRRRGVDGGDKPVWCKPGHHIERRKVMSGVKNKDEKNPDMISSAELIRLGRARWGSSHPPKKIEEEQVQSPVLRNEERQWVQSPKGQKIAREETSDISKPRIVFTFSESQQNTRTTLHHRLQKPPTRPLVLEPDQPGNREEEGQQRERDKA
ncbi:hypothetical protein BDZ89DRAFT_1043857 [Hymenopellis radicata]|nr:hypothetical protein BDZ89DRAFT_1043857 [Hymenopellis radicata]